MISIKHFRQMLELLPDVSELPHFDRPSFRVKKRIFAVIHPDHRIMLKLSPVDQSVYSAIDPAVIYPVPGIWGKRGATFIQLSTIRKKILQELILCAWRNVAMEPEKKINLKKNAS